ncbi:MAG: Arm DNA-binding domain, partial [Mycobacterium sp.]|nr:Arm DNA-binding domain [Mycobacterium sp.]
MAGLTKVDVSRLKPGPRRIVWDSGLKGLGIRITEGAVSYVVDFKVTGKRRRVSLGPVQLQPLERAREAAARILLAARSGVDATIIDTPENVTFRDVWNRLATEVDKNKLAPATYHSYAQRIRPVLAALGDKAVRDVTIADVEACVFALNGDRNRAYAVALIR